MAKIVINQDKIDNIEEVLQICPFEAMEEVDGKIEINAACKMCKMCVKKGFHIFHYRTSPVQHLPHSP